jgi:taurine dioxygenase
VRSSRACEANLETNLFHSLGSPAPAYETLSPGLKAIADSLHVVQANFATQGIIQTSSAVGDFDRSKFNMSAPVHRNVHPLVRQHPETGRRALYTSAVHTEKLDGWSVEESKALLQFFWQHAIKVRS